MNWMLDAWSRYTPKFGHTRCYHQPTGASHLGHSCEDEQNELNTMRARLQAARCGDVVKVTVNDARREHLTDDDLGDHNVRLIISDGPYAGELMRGEHTPLTALVIFFADQQGWQGPGTAWEYVFLLVRETIERERERGDVTFLAHCGSPSACECAYEVHLRSHSLTDAFHELQTTVRALHESVNDLLENGV